MRYLFLSVLILLIPSAVFGQIIINEVAWMGTSASSNCEWLELYNTDTKSVDLNDWNLYEDGGGTLIIKLTGSISANGYYLVERLTPTCPDPVPGFNDTTGSFGGSGLSNDGEYLALKNAEGTLVYSLDASNKWLAGDSVTKNTMQWNGSIWITAPATPRIKNIGVGSSGTSTTTSEGITASVGSMAQTASTVDTRIKPAIVLRMRAPASARVHVPEYFSVDVENVSNIPDIIWSFGDGGVGYGTHAWHTFERKGIYVIVARAPGFGPLALSKQTLIVTDPTLNISAAQDGQDGFITLANSGRWDLDVGGYGLASGARIFILPAGTFILPGGEVDFSNRLTNLSPFVDSVEVRAPDGSVISYFSFVPEIISLPAPSTTTITYAPTPPIQMIHSVKNANVDIASKAKIVKILEIPPIASSTVVIERKKNLLTRFLNMPRVFINMIIGKK